VRRDDAGLWTLQTSIFPENRTSIALHHSAGYRALGSASASANTTAPGATPSFLNAAAPPTPTEEHIRPGQG
jgi:hypothetical protein